MTGNLIENSGGEEGIAIGVQGETEGLIFRKSTLKETRGKAKRVGFKFGQQVGEIMLEDNETAGFAAAILDLRKK